MSIGTNWAEVWKPVWAPVWTQAAPVTVPDVVGLTQAAATASIEGVGLVVSVSTAYSAVPAGSVINQSPVAGSLVTAGSTVTINVSLGAQAESTNSGGWDIGTLRERRLLRTKKELLEERIDLEAVPEPIIEALAPAVRTKVKRAGTITLRAILGADEANGMSAEALEAELDRFAIRTRAQRRKQQLQREDEDLLLL